MRGASKNMSEKTNRNWLLVIPKPSLAIMVITANDQLSFLPRHLCATTIPNARFLPQHIHILLDLLRPLQHQVSAKQVSVLERIKGVLRFMFRSELQEGKTA